MGGYEGCAPSTPSSLPKDADWKSESGPIPLLTLEIGEMKGRESDATWEHYMGINIAPGIEGDPATRL